MKKALLMGLLIILFIPSFFYSDASTMASNANNTDSIDDSNEKVTIDIKGQIKNPGVYVLDAGSNVNDAIMMAGGITNGSTDCINMARLLNNEDLIIVPESCDETNIININTAGLQMLSLLPGIGESRANDIIEYRTENGNFNKKEDIMNVNGIGESTYSKIEQSITI